MTSPSAPLALPRGKQWRNRLALSALTNVQSYADGTLSPAEIAWLVSRAEAGFGLVMTAAAFVSPEGRAWEGQLGISDDAHLPGLSQLATALREAGASSCVQLHHGGHRATATLTGQLLSPYPQGDAEVMTPADIERVINDFALAAARAEKAGFDGVEIHGAHGYLLQQFLQRANQRTDGYGGDLAGRSRIVHRVIDAIRAATGPDFQLGLRLSGANQDEDEDLLELAETFLADSRLDFVEASLWDYRRKLANDSDDAPTIAQRIAALPRVNALGFTGQIRSAAAVAEVLELGSDFVAIGRGAIADKFFAQRCLADPSYPGPSYPVTRQQLHEAELGEGFVEFFAKGWPSYVTQ